MNLLIIERDKDLLLFLKQAFHGEGFIVDAAEDGTEGLYKAKINHYDVLLLDSHLPNKSGKEVCCELRASNSTTRIIMLSVTDTVDTKLNYSIVELTIMLPNRFAFSELLARTRALLRRPETIKESVIEHAGLCVDTLRHTVTYNGESVFLTLKEFGFLEYLMHNRGLILSRISILEHVWGVNADPFTNTVETHVLTLRKKLGDDSKTLIRTVSGLGYKIM